MRDDSNNKEKEDLDVIEEDFSSDIEGKIKKIKDELKECRKKSDEYLAGWQRAKADLINARKDEEKARQLFVKYAGERMMRELLDVLDGLEQALSAPSLDEKFKEGFGNIKDRLLQMMRGYGLGNIESKGELFDPAEHESVAEEEVLNPDQDQKVLEEIQRGYKIYDKVLRPAKVKIGVYKAAGKNNIGD